MKRAAVLMIGAIAVASALGAAPAWAAPTTEVVQGDVLRLVSVADWDVASSLLPGQPVQWDVTVSADAPDPGIVSIGISATGDAPLVVDVASCAEAWEVDGCPAGATALQTSWGIPRDGVAVPLTEIADSEIAHLRLSVALDASGVAGSTDIRVHAQGAGETVVAGPGGGLATTGMSPIMPWILGGGAALVLLGVTLVALRRRRSHEAEQDQFEEEPS